MNTTPEPIDDMPIEEQLVRAVKQRNALAKLLSDVCVGFNVFDDAEWAEWANEHNHDFPTILETLQRIAQGCDFEDDAATLGTLKKGVEAIGLMVKLISEMVEREDAGWRACEEVLGNTFVLEGHNPITDDTDSRHEGASWAPEALNALLKQRRVRG